MVRETVVPIIHVSQLYSVLGLSSPTDDGELRYANDLANMMEAWSGIVRSLDWDTLVAPTPARNRSTRDLLVDVFERIREAPNARRTGEYRIVLSTEHVVQTLTSHEDAVAYAARHIADWHAFLMEYYNEERTLIGPSVEVWEEAPGRRREKGSVPFSVVLAFLCNHTAVHLRQVTTALDRAGVKHPGDGLDAYSHLHLPADVFGADADKMGRLDHTRF